MKLTRKDIAEKPGASDRAAGWIAGAILKSQNKFTTVLGNKSKVWKRKHQLIFLCTICLVFGSLSIFSIINSPKISKPTSISAPRNIHEIIPVRITEHEFRKVQSFKNSLDSSSKKKLMEERPGLLDSLEMVEQLYYSQKK